MQVNLEIGNKFCFKKQRTISLTHHCPVLSWAWNNSNRMHVFTVAKITIRHLTLSNWKKPLSLGKFENDQKSLREYQQLGFAMLNCNLAVSGWVGLAYDC